MRGVNAAARAASSGRRAGADLVTAGISWNLLQSTAPAPADCQLPRRPGIAAAPAGLCLVRLPMLIKRALDIRSSEITDEKSVPASAGVHKDRRRAGRGRIGGPRASPRAGVRAGRASQRPEGRRHPRRSPDAVGGRDHVQQLLRVRDGQERPRPQCEELSDQALDGEDRRPGEQARRLPFRGSRSRPTGSKSASTGSDASRRGRWSSRGSASR